jgi:hypothetical protein
MISKFQVLILTSVLFLSFSQPSYSGKPESCLLFSITSKNVARIGVINREKSNLELSISNESGTVLYTQKVFGFEDYFKLVDLTDMPDGDYKVKLTGGEKSYQKGFSINNKTATIIKKKKEIKPVFRLLNEEILLVSYLNAMNNNVNIFFEINEDVVFEERNIQEMPVTKKYSLEKLPPGEYIVKLYSGGKIYQYPLAVK